MAERRMFAKTIVTSDAFLDMTNNARSLYFTLGMYADDDGFVNNVKSVIRAIGVTQDDLEALIKNKFVIAFESGIIAIKHWRINNYLRNDRHQPTKYNEEKQRLNIEENGAYTLKDTAVYQRYTNGIPNNGIPNNGIPSIEEDSIGKVSIGKLSIEEGEHHRLPISSTEEIALSELFIVQLRNTYPGFDIPQVLQEIRLKLIASNYPCGSEVQLSKYVMAWFRNLAIDREKAKAEEEKGKFPHLDAEQLNAKIREITFDDI